MRLRTVISLHADPFLTGCGFALTLGWLWFAGLGELWQAGTAEFLAVRAHEGLLLLTFGAGCVVFGFVAGFVTRRERPHLSAVQAVSLAHGGALLCLGLLFAVDRPLTGIVIAGLAEACLGIYWMSRMLVLEPAQSVAALAWASFTALLMAGLVSTLPPGTGIAFGVAGCWLSAWLFALALTARREKTGHAAQTESPKPSGPAWEKHVFTLCATLWLAFFALGAMYGMPMPHAGPFAAMTLHLAGAALAVPVLSPFFRSTSDLDVRPAVFTAIVALFFAGCCLLLFPSFASSALDMGSAFLEAACLAGFMTLTRRSGLASNPGSVPRLAGLYLAALILAVNMGHWAGRGIMRTHGVPGTAFFVTMLLVALGFVHTAASRTAARRQREEHPTRQSVTLPDVPADPVKLRGEIVEQLNMREQTVAVLLVQGYANKKIAECLSVTEDAVRWHIKNLNKKMGATNRQQLFDILTKDDMSA